jgi:hypothetical protein
MPAKRLLTFSELHYFVTEKMENSLHAELVLKPWVVQMGHTGTCIQMGKDLEVRQLYFDFDERQAESHLVKISSPHEAVNLSLKHIYIFFVTPF